MNSEWYSPKEIAQIPGMPGTIQGVHKRAKREGWPSRRRLGVQGPAMEYQLGAPSPSQLQEPSAAYRANTPDLPQFDSIWLLAFQQCSEEEKGMLISHLMTHGILHFLAATTSCQLKQTPLLRQHSEEDLETLLEGVQQPTTPQSC